MTATTAPCSRAEAASARSSAASGEEKRRGGRESNATNSTLKPGRERKERKREG